MSRKYKFHYPDGVYFITFAIDYAGGKGILDKFVVE